MQEDTCDSGGALSLEPKWLRYGRPSSSVVARRRPSSSVVVRRRPSSSVVVPSSVVVRRRPSSSVVVRRRRRRRPSSSVVVRRRPSSSRRRPSSPVVRPRSATSVAIRWPVRSRRGRATVVGTVVALRRDDRPSQEAVAACRPCVVRRPSSSECCVRSSLQGKRLRTRCTGWWRRPAGKHADRHRVKE